MPSRQETALLAEDYFAERSAGNRDIRGGHRPWCTQDEGHMHIKKDLVREARQEISTTLLIVRRLPMEFLQKHTSQCLQKDQSSGEVLLQA